jgi:hypothetical protein
VYNSGYALRGRKLKLKHRTIILIDDPNLDSLLPEIFYNRTRGVNFVDRFIIKEPRRADLQSGMYSFPPFQKISNGVEWLDPELKEAAGRV